MAGHGPAPKDPSRRARSNADPIPLRVLPRAVSAQPELPEVMPDGEPWPLQTVRWWAMWAESPLSADFTSTDWSVLLDTAILHGQMWSGDSKVAAELRLRVAKYGATPEDRARLRITFATADDVEDKRDRKAPSARERRGPLTSAG